MSRAILVLRAVLATVIAAVAFASSVACVASNPVDDYRFDSTAVQTYEPQEIARWRADDLPAVLDAYSRSDKGEWMVAAETILGEHERAPKYLREALCPDLAPLHDAGRRASMDRGEWLAACNTAVRLYKGEGKLAEALEESSFRTWLATEGVVYRQLAKFNTDQRDAWTEARELLCSIGTVGEDANAAAANPYQLLPREAYRNRCIVNLVLRLNSQPRLTASSVVSAPRVVPTHQRNPEDVDRSTTGNILGTHIPMVADFQDQALEARGGAGLNADTALWAMSELLAIGDPCAPYLVFALYLTEADVRYIVDGGASSKFSQLVQLVLVSLGEAGVPYLLEDLVQSDQIADSDLRFTHKRTLVKVLGDVYLPEKWLNPEWLQRQIELAWPADVDSRPDDAAVREEFQRFPARWEMHRPDWQDNPKHLVATLRGIATQVEHYDPGTDIRRYMMALYCIRAFKAIGSELALPILVDLWADNLDDESLVYEIMATLRSLTPRMLNRLDEWQSYAATIDDPRR